MKIGLARIDDRLIHGQVATRWTKETNVSRIIVVSDEVAADHVRKTLLTQVARRGHRSRGGRGEGDPRLEQPEVRQRPRNAAVYQPDRRLAPGGRRRGYSIRQYRRHGVPSGKTQVNNAVSVDEKISKRLRN